MSLLVLGIGNVLLMDEGIGVYAVEELGRRYELPVGVELLDGGTSGIELLGYLQKKNHLLIIDAIRGGHPPGTVLRVEGEDVPVVFQTKISPHQLGISDLLATAMLTGCIPEKIVLFGIEPKLVQMGLGLSDEVKSSLDILLERIVSEIRNLGYPVEINATSHARTNPFWPDD